MIGIFGDSYADTNLDTGGAGIGRPLPVPYIHLLAHDIGTNLVCRPPHD